MYKTDTRSRSASATDAASYPTYVYLDFEYQYTAQPIVFVALRQRFASSQGDGQRVPGMVTHIRNDPISV